MEEILILVVDYVTVVILQGVFGKYQVSKHLISVAREKLRTLMYEFFCSNLLDVTKNPIFLVLNILIVAFRKKKNTY